jgi:hypothetical protein
VRLEIVGTTGRSVLIGLTASVALAWVYVELNTAALHLGAQHHDARCQDHRPDGIPKVAR